MAEGTCGYDLCKMEDHLSILIDSPLCQVFLEGGEGGKRHTFLAIQINLIVQIRNEATCWNT